MCSDFICKIFYLLYYEYKHEKVCQINTTHCPVAQALRTERNFIHLEFSGYVEL